MRKSYLKLTLFIALLLYASGAFSIQITIGDGTFANTPTGAPTPYGTWYKNFRQQYLYTSAELLSAGAAAGLINAIAFNVQALNTCSPMPNYRIRLKSTQQTELSSTFEPGEYTQVWSHDKFLPSVGWNTHFFSEPYLWDGTSNLIVDIVTDLIPGNYTINAEVYYTASGFLSSLRYQSDTSPAINATSGSTSSYRSNTRFNFEIAETGSLTGTVSEDIFPVANADLVIEDTIYSTTSDESGGYHFDYVPQGTYTVTASKYGYTPVSHTVSIIADQETQQDFLLVGTPEFFISHTQWNFGNVTVGGSSSQDFSISNIGGGILNILSITISGSDMISLSNLPALPQSLRNEQQLTFSALFEPLVQGTVEATVTITDDQGTRHEIDYGLSPGKSSTLRQTHTLNLSGNGVNDITIGDGSSTARIPMDFYYKNSLYETIFTAAEMEDFVGIITGIKFYNDFSSNLPGMPVKIWLGSTMQTDLTAGWIPATDLTLVFDGTVDFPAGQNIIEFEFPEYYMHLDGGNLVMMVNRPMDTDWYSSSDKFRTQSGANNRARNFYNDSTECDPTAPVDGSTTSIYPMTTFVVIPGGVGHISGVVREGTTYLEGVSVSLNDGSQSFITGADGEFVFMNLLPDSYQLSFSKHAYITQNLEVEVVEDETTVLDIELEAMPRVAVSGNLIASDNLQGIMGATITLQGYEDYQTQSLADGSFIFTQVVANQTYNYLISHPEYSSLQGQLELGDSDYNFGVQIMNEIAYAPYSLQAEVNVQNSVNLTWQEPNTSAVGISESFEAVEFPPQDWSQIITDDGGVLSNGAMPTWSRAAEITSGSTVVTPGSGQFQAGLWWDYEHQDEWLITEEFLCPSDAVLSFESYVYLGSTNGDNYYVKVFSESSGIWETVWNASTETGGWNEYTAPIVIDLSLYYGQQIKLAFHAEDPPSNDGLWYQWFIDEVEVYPAIAARSRSLTGYKLWRLHHGDEQNEAAWIALTAQPVVGLEYCDEGWQSVPAGEYKWAVKAAYSNEVYSSASFSNALIKGSSAPAAPQNLSISAIDNSVLLSWDAVEEDESGNPLSIDHYEVHLLENAEQSPSPYTIYSITEGTSLLIEDILLYLEHSFFCVRAVSGASSKQELPQAGPQRNGEIGR
ncbi:MAG: large repetitive protein [Candidatus Cloacimonadota bacterium]|nr:large repetitive protein [Candidatus Cloacimonadota bacterium]